MQSYKDEALYWSWTDDSIKFQTIREQCDINLIVLNLSLLETYERMVIVT